MNSVVWRQAMGEDFHKYGVELPQAMLTSGQVKQQQTENNDMKCAGTKKNFIHMMLWWHQKSFAG